ncbi:MAG: hypothetical protein JRE71_10345 [Deltaproteobacteria bacterium]|nr:hypothetical protein [Deltaproteobacteria bacterium]
MANYRVWHNYEAILLRRPLSGGALAQEAQNGTDCLGARCAIREKKRELTDLVGDEPKIWGELERSCDISEFDFIELFRQVRFTQHDEMRDRDDQQGPVALHVNGGWLPAFGQATPIGGHRRGDRLAKRFSIARCVEQLVEMSCLHLRRLVHNGSASTGRQQRWPGLPSVSSMPPSGTEGQFNNAFDRLYSALCQTSGVQSLPFKRRND